MASLKRVVSEESPFEYAPTENQYHVDGVRVTVVLNARPQLSSLLLQATCPGEGAAHPSVGSVC